jgi:hypothetical protein
MKEAYIGLHTERNGSRTAMGRNRLDILASRIGKHVLACSDHMAVER